MTYSLEIREKALERYKSGLTTRRVASELGVSKFAVYEWARQAGIARKWVGTPEHKAQLERASKRAREVWIGTPEHKAHLKRIQKCAREIWIGTPEHKAHLKRIQKRAREVWIGTPEHKAQLDRLHNSPEHKAQLKCARERAREVWIGTPEHKAQLDRLHKDPEILKKKAVALRERPTQPEKEFISILDSHPELQGWVYEYSIPEARTIPDFTWPEQKVALYLDGFYMHKTLEVRNRDQKIRMRLTNLGWKVIRVNPYKHDFKTIISKLLVLLAKQ